MKKFYNYILLLENNRIKKLKDKYSEKIPKEVIEYFEKNDPTPNKAYFEWLLKAYSNLDTKEIEKLKELKTPIHETFIKFIEKYNKLKPKLSREEANINNYSHILQLYKIIENNINKDYSNSAIKKEGKVDILVNNYEWLIFTPYDFEVSEKYGHNNVKEGKNWCVCYDEDSFIHHFGPSGSLTFIINKLDETKDLALKKEKDGYIEVWDYNDDNVLGFYINNQKNFISYLQKYTEGNEFLIEYFKENPITKEDLPDVDLTTLRNRWIDYNIDYVEDYLSEYESENYIIWELLEKELYSELLNSTSLDEAKNDLIDHVIINLSKDSYNEDEVKNNMSSSELIKLLKANGEWENFISMWFDMYIRDNREKLLDYYRNMPSWAQVDFIDVTSFMRDISEDIDKDILFQYYNY